MSIQDDIFDVEDALEESSAKEAFDRILSVFNSMEIELDLLRSQLKDFKSVLKILEPD